MSIEAKAAKIKQLKDQLEDENYHKVLFESIIRENAFRKDNVYRREIIVPVETCKRYEDIENYIIPRLDANLSEKPLVAGNYEDLFLPFDFEKNQSNGKIAFVLPTNGLINGFCRSILPAFFLGNDVVLRFPQRNNSTSMIFEENYLDIFKEHIQISHEPSSVFLKKCLRDPAIDTLMIYGNNVWIKEYWDQFILSGKKIIFEGPGNDAIIVTESSDLQLAAEGTLRGILNNDGQSCTATKRIYVHSTVLNDYLKKLVPLVKRIEFINPEESIAGSHQYVVGPILSAKIRQNIETQHQDAMNFFDEEKGEVKPAEMIVEPFTKEDNFYGKPILYYKPAIYLCHAKMKMVVDETFYPVIPIVTYDTEDELIRYLNYSSFGINCNVFGNCSESTFSNLWKMNRLVYKDSLATDLENFDMSSRVDGGRKESSYVLKTKNNSFYRIDGPRCIESEAIIP